MSSRSFGITVRTRVGMNEEFKKQFDKWIRLQHKGAYVFEMEGNDEHIHAQIWLETARTKGNITKPLRCMLQRCYKPDEYILKHALLIKPAYNDDFVDEYMVKDGGLSYSCLPEASSDYYPTEEEQLKFMEITENKKNWTLWNELKGLWNEDTPVNKLTVAKFLGECMFQKKVIKVEMDPRKRMQIATTFLLYMNDDESAHAKAFLPKDCHQLFDMANG